MSTKVAPEKYFPESGNSEDFEVVSEDKEPIQQISQDLWSPLLTPISRGTIYTAIVVLLIFIALVILGFFVVTDGYNLFCISFFENTNFKKALEEQRKKTNDACPLMKMSL